MVRAFSSSFSLGAEVYFFFFFSNQVIMTRSRTKTSAHAFYFPCGGIMVVLIADRVVL